MAVEKKIVWPYGKSSTGKASKSLWKTIRKAKTKEQLKSAIYQLANALQDVEGKLYELKRFVGKRKEY
jgi:hypothetical protein